MPSSRTELHEDPMRLCFLSLWIKIRTVHKYCTIVRSTLTCRRRSFESNPANYETNLCRTISHIFIPVLTTSTDLDKKYDSSLILSTFVLSFFHPWFDSTVWGIHPDLSISPYLPQTILLFGEKHRTSGIFRRGTCVNIKPVKFSAQRVKNGIRSPPLSIIVFSCSPITIRSFHSLILSCSEYTTQPSIHNIDAIYNKFWTPSTK